MIDSKAVLKSHVVGPFFPKETKVVNINGHVI